MPPKATRSVASTAPAPAASAPTSVTQALPAIPSFTRQIARPGMHPRTAGWQWAMLIVLSLTLALQVLLADRARLAADAAWRPLITRLCGALGCSIPPWHQPGAFSMLSRDVSPIAGSAGGLNVQATFRNDARWAQAWPVLLLSLSDADGRVLGSRAFTPREYLGAAATPDGTGPGTERTDRIAAARAEPQRGRIHLRLSLTEADLPTRACMRANHALDSPPRRKLPSARRAYCPSFAGEPPS